MSRPTGTEPAAEPAPSQIVWAWSWIRSVLSQQPSVVWTLTADQQKLFYKVEFEIITNQYKYWFVIIFMTESEDVFLMLNVTDLWNKQTRHRNDKVKVQSDPNTVFLLQTHINNSYLSVKSKELLIRTTWQHVITLIWTLIERLLRVVDGASSSFTLESFVSVKYSLQLHVKFTQTHTLNKHLVIFSLNVFDTFHLEYFTF